VKHRPAPRLVPASKPINGIHSRARLSQEAERADIAKAADALDKMLADTHALIAKLNN
jgi:hypothetical protein